ncbi:hypothetical protein BS78_03G078300 [Paspalum vaginatum]|nr:hypothetical protein BS78_03G078300 [Paspalum vaginatum]KAJ1282780.1 hypothetical protein BS78_03G078300 [Paspalum vaginatum]
MALRQALGWSEGEVMQPESKPCSRLMRQTAASSPLVVVGGLAFWVLCRLHYGPRITVPRSLRMGVMRCCLCERDINTACAAL